jgi:helicase
MMEMETLPISQLAAHGFSPRLLERWAETGVRELLPLQVKAVREYGFLQGGNLLVLAPTSSGKTFLAEMAALKRMETGRRAIYLVPTKALAEEKGRQFRERYGPLGYRVAVATRERPETDRLVGEGRFDLLVAVYEKMKAYLVSRPELLSQVGLVVVDETQSLGERGRGEGLDLLLAKIVASPYGTQFIGLSAVLGEGNRLADWLRCELLLYRSRPVELSEGVLDCSSGQFRYRRFNSGEEGEETLAPEGVSLAFEDEDQGEEAALTLGCLLTETRAEQVLYFVPTRNLSRRWAVALSERLGLGAAEEAVDELECFEPTASRDLLLQCLRSSVAFHNADLSADLRSLVESHYQQGAIRAIVSTPTLGQGVNLTGRNVIQVPRMAATDAWTGETTMVPLSVGRWSNQGGRAGRYALESDFGRSILLASGPEEGERLFRRYVGGELEALEAPLRGRPLEGAAMDLAASGVASDREAMAAVLEQTYTGIAYWRGAGSELNDALERALERLGEAELIRPAGAGAGFAPTGLGKAMALHGLRIESMGSLAAWLGSLGNRVPEPFETLVVLSATADGSDFPTPLGMLERRERDYAADARERLAHEVESSPPLRQVLHPAGGFTAAELGALKKAFLLEAWIGGAETADLEERFGMLAGTMANLAGHIHWLSRAALDAAEALGLSRPQRAALETLAARLPLGLETEALGLSRLRIEGLSRGAIHALTREGYDSVRSLHGVREEELSRVVPLRVAQALVEEVARLQAEDADGLKSCGDDEENGDGEAAPPRLSIDLGDPGRARLDGREVDLTPLPYRLLTILARAAPKVLPRADVSARLWPDSSVEDQQLTQHYRAIGRAFAKAVGREKARGLIVIRRGHGLGLALEKHEIRIEG